MSMDLVQRGREFIALYDPKQTVGLVADLTAEVARLREALSFAGSVLENRGRHFAWCGAHSPDGPGPECTCGFADDLERVREERADEMQRAGRSMGRAFANSAATMYREQLADANAKLQAVAADAARLLDHMNTVPDIANAAVPFIERVAALKLEVQDA